MANKKKENLGLMATLLGIVISLLTLSGFTSMIKAWVDKNKKLTTIILGVIILALIAYVWLL